MDTTITAETLQQANSPASANQQAQIKEEVSKFQRIVRAENTPVLHIKAVFPFDFFPNEVIIDKTKVTIVKKFFFWARHVTTILIADILNVSVNQSILFGELSIADRYFAQVPFTVNYLWKQDAAKAASIIQGMVLANKENIDVKRIPSETLAQHAEVVGMPEVGRDSDML